MPVCFGAVDTTFVIKDSTYGSDLRFRYGNVILQRQNIKSTRPQFNAAVDLIVDNFRSEANFSSIDFRNKASFSGSTFFDDVLFNGSTFTNSSFNGTEFRKDASFRNTVFSHSVCFSSMGFTDSAMLILDNATLPDTIYFAHIRKIPFQIDLMITNLDSSVSRDRQIGLYLYQSDISRFHFDYKHFKLIFSDPQHKEILSNDEKTAIYESALKNFKDSGQMESYKLLDIEYQEFKMGFMHWIPFLWNCYGYNKSRVFLYVLFFLTLFSFINYFRLPYLNAQVYKVITDEGMELLVQNPRSWGIIQKRVWYTFYYTSCIFFPLTLKIEKIRYKNMPGTLYLLFMYTIGIVCIAYLANFVLQK